MIFCQSAGIWQNIKKRKSACNGILMMMIIITAFVFLCIPSSFAAEELMKYQVVPGGDDKAYLVDTTTGAVWVLTYRTLVTGREPIAIPYKFIKISPKKKNEFLVEDVQGASMPIGEKR